jgi:hypothetical protein
MGGHSLPGPPISREAPASDPERQAPPAGGDSYGSNKSFFELARYGPTFRVTGAPFSPAAAIV